MNSKLWIPPPNVRVRIVGSVTRYAIFSNKRDAKAFGHFDMTTPYDDQYWYIIPDTGKYAGQYLIKSAYTDQCLYINPRGGNGGDVGTTQPVGMYGDQFFTLEQGSGTRAGQFRLVTPSVKAVLFSRTASKPQLGCIDASQVFDDHWFTFNLEPMEFTSITYDIQKASILSTQPKNIFSQKMTNKSSADQDQSVKMSETTEQQSTFEAEVGLELGVSTEISCGLPGLAGGKVEVSAKMHSNLKWGTTNTRSQTWEAVVNLKVPSGKTMMVTGTVSESIINVPFKAQWKSPKTGQTMTTSGMFKGIGSSDLSTNFFNVQA